MAKNHLTLKVSMILCMIGITLHAPAQETKIIEVTDEIPCDANATVFIGNTIRRVTVLTTHENKVRLVTTVAIEGKCIYTNAEWLKILELKVSGTATNVGVKSGNMQPVDDWDSRFPRRSFPRPSTPHRVPPLPQRQTPGNKYTPNGTVVFDDKGNWLYKTDNIRRNIFVYVPAGAKLNIDSRYAEIILDGNVKDVDARITNGSMTMKDVGRLVLNSSAGSIYAANIGQADVQLNHGWFHAKDIAALEITSKSSTIELGALGQLKINSNDDQYEIESADDITGEKNYASIRVNNLKRSLDLAGINADIKVHNIDPGVSLVKIDGRYADLRLPVDNLKDYTVQFEGTGSNLYTPFERVHATDSSFNVTIGTGKKISFRLKCSNCTLDMK